MRANMRKEINKAVIANMGLPDDTVLHGEVVMSSLDMDSLDEIELFMELERLFNIDLPDVRLHEIRYLNDIYILVAEILTD